MRSALRLLLICCCLPLLAACAARSAADAIPTVRLNDLQPLPPTPPAEVVPLRVAVAAVISPRGNVESYTPLLNYLANKLGRPVEMVQRRTYQEVNDLLRDGQVDVAFVCTSAYVAGKRDFGMQLLAAPQVNGATVYYSNLIVPAESPARGITDLRAVASATLENVRRLALELRPSVLDDLGLAAALRRYAAEYAARFKIPVDVQIVGLEDHRLAPEVETALYRIVQEALTNVAKYANATHVSVLLERRDGQLTAIIEDNGCGFEAERVLRSGAAENRLGLYGMRERAELIGGALTIESQTGCGTTVYVRIPMADDRRPLTTDG